MGRHEIRNKGGRFAPNPANVGKHRKGRRSPIIKRREISGEMAATKPPTPSEIDSIFQSGGAGVSSENPVNGSGGAQAGAAAVDDFLKTGNAGGVDAGGTPQVGTPAAHDPSFDMNWEIVVSVGNGILRQMLPNPDMAMRAEEETGIGRSLDAVIAKYWPNLKTAGPESALALALGAYLIRVYMLIRAERQNASGGAVSKPQGASGVEPRASVAGGVSGEM